MVVRLGDEVESRSTAGKVEFVDDCCCPWMSEVLAKRRGRKWWSVETVTDGDSGVDEIVG